MSDILIRGMEMPTSCDMCWALDDYGDYPKCRITEEQRGYNFPIREKRMDRCPLVPVPAHGRLIDADALGNSLEKLAADKWNQKTAPVNWSYAFEECLEMVDNAPTIIEQNFINAPTIIEEER